MSESFRSARHGATLTLKVEDLFGVAAALRAAEEARLLPALLDGPAPAEGYAARLGLDPIATERVLDVLAAAGLAERGDAGFDASAALRDLAAHAPPGSLEAASAFWGQTTPFLLRGERWAQMDGSRADRAAAYRVTVPRLARYFADAAAELADRLPPAGRILDVGAGSGIWSLSMARRTPGSRVTAVDLPEVLPAFEAQAAAMGLRDRTAMLPGDFHAVELPAGQFDRIVAANILHLEQPAAAAALVVRLAGALAANGELVVVDALGDGSPAREVSRAVYALHLAFRTGRGRAHPLAEIREWVVAAGLRPTEPIPLATAPAALGALVARRRA